jgi:predicted PurR-regulated permease PerM
MNDEDFRKFTTVFVLLGLVVLSFFLLKPLLISIILGTILAFIFLPLYNLTVKLVKSRNFAAFLMCILLMVIIVIPLWYLAPIAINQSIKFYMASQQMDLVTTFKTIFPSFFQSEAFSAEIGAAIQSFITKTTNSLMNSLSNVILNFTTIFLQFLVAFFTFFFVLKDSRGLIDYVKSLLPFPKEIERKLFTSTKSITMSILYGQVIIGIFQGLIAGLGFFIFKVPNALLLTVLAAIAGILPIIGTAIIWVPVAIYFLIAGNTFSAIGIIIFGLISTIVESFLRPLWVARATKVNSSVLLIGMIGGMFMFGILGLILGPLILSYLLIVLEVYRNKKIPGIFIEEPKKD